MDSGRLLEWGAIDFAALLSDALTLHSLATLALLIGLELVLGIDNVLVISIVVSRLPEHERDRARVMGLVIALVARLIFVARAFWLVQLTKPHSGRSSPCFGRGINHGN